MTPSPFAGSRDLYLLAAGILLGIVLGPAVLEKASPRSYAALFGAGEMYDELRSVLVQADEHLAAFESGEPTGDALLLEQQKVAQQIDAAGQLFELEMTAKAIRMIAGLLVALALVFAVEAYMSPGPLREGDTAAVVSPALSRLVTLRYALMAGLITVLLARAPLFEQVPWVFTLAVLGVGFVAAFVPLGRKGD